MTTDNSLTKTHITKLRNVYSSLKMRQKMNDKCTQLILSTKNQNEVDEVCTLIGQAINKLQNIK